MPCFFRSSSASVTPFERFSPIGASGPVMELMKPIFTFVAPCAKAGISSVRIASRTMNRFIRIAPVLFLEVEELQLEGGLVQVLANRGLQLAERELDVEVVHVRVPVQANQVPLLALGFVRGGEAAPLVA